jgi:conjugative transfer region protein TrbK
MTSLARFAAIAFVVVIIIIAIGEASRMHEPGTTSARVSPASDPPAADLARCRDVTAEQIASDDTCRHVWAENRRRFLAPHNRPDKVR